MKLNKNIPDSIWHNPWHFLAFGFGSGASPVAPGTAGTLVAIPLYLLLAPLSLPVYLGIVLLMLLAGIWLCHVTARDIGVHDHSGIVWDEFVGYLLTMAAAPEGWLWIFVGFILFRVFDIFKPWPIGLADRHVSGGFGIMLDDVIAALYAWLSLQLVVYLW